MAISKRKTSTQFWQMFMAFVLIHSQNWIAAGHHKATLIYPPRDLKIVSYMGDNYCCGISDLLLAGPIQDWKLSEGLKKNIRLFPYPYQHNQTVAVVGNISSSTAKPFNNFASCKWIKIKSDCNGATKTFFRPSVKLLCATLLFLAFLNSTNPLQFFLPYHPIVFTIHLLWLVVNKTSKRCKAALTFFLKTKYPFSFLFTTTITVAILLLPLILSLLFPEELNTRSDLIKISSVVKK